jgi:Na+-transporting methylmalonyl-CoA/oxaloacetate decarboxylase gamma subunit
MKKRLPSVIIFIALYLTLGVMSELAAQQKKQETPPPQVGGYQAAPKADPAVVAAAKAAVSERQQKEGGDLTLVSIKRAETQLVAGINYRLCLKVKAKDKSQTVTVVINKTLDDKYSITSWETGGCKKR